MNCGEVRRFLSAYLDSELDRAATFAVGEHLARCGACRRRFEAELLVDRKIAIALQADGVTDAEWRRIVRPINQDRGLLRRRMVLAALSLAASFVLLLAAGWWFRAPARMAPSAWVEELLADAGGNSFDVSHATPLQAGATLPITPFDDLSLVLAPQKLRGHEIRLVRIESTDGPSGARVARLRLNCCGEPVLLLVAKNGQSEPLSEFTQNPLAETRPIGLVRDVSYQYRRVGDYVVVALSRHPVTELVHAVHAREG